MRVAISNDYEIVVAGIAAALMRYSDRVELVELDVRAPASSDVDVVLHDTFGRPPGDALAPDLFEAPDHPRVVVFSWNTEPRLVHLAFALGAVGYVAKSLSAEEIVTALERVHAGERVLAVGTDGDGDGVEVWPARDHGLSEREAEVLALITQGYSNQQIADQCYLSINSIKTYIRTAYRKIGVSRRAQAVGWAIGHGLDRDRSRIILADDSSVTSSGYRRSSWPA